MSVDYVNSAKKSVAVIHAQGESRVHCRDMFYWMREQPCAVPEWVGVVTCCNGPMLDQAELIVQLEKNNIPYVNPAVNVRCWENGMKPRLIVEAIISLDKKFTHVLCLDSIDVMLNGAFERALPGYDSYCKPVLFGASRNNHPNRIIDKVPDRDWRGNFRYLNAGTSFGPRHLMLEFYEAVASLPRHEQEQILVRTAFATRQDWVEFDWKCEMFQTLGNAEIAYGDDHVMVT